MQALEWKWRRDGIAQALLPGSVHEPDDTDDWDAYRQRMNEYRRQVNESLSQVQLPEDTRLVRWYSDDKHLIHVIVARKRMPVSWIGKTNIGKVTILDDEFADWCKSQSDYDPEAAMEYGDEEWVEQFVKQYRLPPGCKFLGWRAIEHGFRVAFRRGVPQLTPKQQEELTNMMKSRPMVASSIICAWSRYWLYKHLFRDFPFEFFETEREAYRAVVQLEVARAQYARYRARMDM